jgi:hypothetical protein
LPIPETFTVRVSPWVPEAWGGPTSGPAAPVAQEDGSALLTFSLVTTPGQLMFELPAMASPVLEALGALAGYYEGLATLRAQEGA